MVSSASWFMWSDFGYIYVLYHIFKFGIVCFMMLYWLKSQPTNCLDSCFLGCIWNLELFNYWVIHAKINQFWLISSVTYWVLIHKVFELKVFINIPILAQRVNWRFLSLFNTYKENIFLITLGDWWVITTVIRLLFKFEIG